MKTNLVKPEVAALESCHAAKNGVWLFSSACHLLSRLVLVPLLAGGLPFDQAIDLSDGFPIVDAAGVHASLEQSIHVKLATTVRSVA